MASPFSPVETLHRMSVTALMAALITAGALLHIQIGPVPVTFQEIFVCLAGFVLGPRYGVYAVALYIAAGLLGLPVFSGGRSGFAHVLGPTGGYLVGFLFLAFFAGVGARLVQRYAPEPPATASLEERESLALGAKVVGLAFAPAAVGMLLLYTCGVLWMVMRLGWPLDKAIALGVTPFLPLGLPKVALASLLFRVLRKRGLAGKW